MSIHPSSDFITITQKNIIDVTRALETQKGMIIIPHPEYYTSNELRLTGRFTIHVFIDGRLSPENTTVYPHQSRDVMKTRQYRLFPCRKQPDISCLSEADKKMHQAYHPLDALYAQAETLFQRLKIDDSYELTIAAEYVAAYGLDFSRDNAIYIPSSASPKMGLIHVFRGMMELWNNQEPLTGGPQPFRFPVDHVDTLVNYVLPDLKTGEVLKHNVEAGQAADRLVGF